MRPGILQSGGEGVEAVEVGGAGKDAAGGV
jgi:hypothetical protein